MMKLLSPRTLVILGALSLATGLGATVTAVRTARGDGDCCYPGSPCCQGRHRAG
jgi:hypothetical protein